MQRVAERHAALRDPHREAADALDDAVKAADVIFVATPDLVIADVYKKDIAPNLTKGKALLFSHGFAIHFKTVKPPKNIDVIMVAPKGPGHLVRRQ